MAMRYLSAAGPFLRRRLRPPTIPDPTPRATVAFADRRSCLADVYSPAGAKDAPTAFIVHGGGFVGGSRRMSSVRVVIDELLRDGFVVASIDYRLVRPWGPLLEGQAQDVQDAARWWSEAAPDFGGHPDRTSLIGLSAGGGLALMAAQAARFSHFIGIYGAYDLTLLPARLVTATPLARSAKREEQAARSPLLSGLFDQPALLVHGDEDPLAVPEHTARLAAARLERSLPTQTHWVGGAVHGFLQDGADHPHSAQTLGAMREFLAAV